MEATVESPIPRSVFSAVPHLISFPADKFQVDYDKEADVLYLSFERPQKATDTETGEDGIIRRYRDGRLVGLTILDASTRLEPDGAPGDESRNTTNAADG